MISVSCKRAALLCIALLMSGCMTGNYVVLLESPDGTTGAVVIDDAKGKTRLDQKSQGANIGAGSRVVQVPDSQISREFSMALASRPPLPQRFLLYFKIGSADLTEQSERAIDHIFEAIRLRGPSAVSVTGHTDTLSGQRWNEQLGLIRAKAVADLLRRRNIDVIDLHVTSHGERNLLIETPDGVSEPRNRRVEISIR